MGSAIDVRVDQAKAASSKEPIAEIDVNDFQAARRSSKVKNFLAEALEYGKKLERDGRIQR
jgi:hypothetical protein